MKFVIDKAVYNGLLNKVKRNLLSSGDDNPMRYIVHDAREDGLRLIASNFKSRAEFFLPFGNYINILETGTACIFGPKLVDLVNIFPDGKLHVFTEKNSSQERACLSVDGKKRKNAYWIPCTDISIYPFNEFVLSSQHRHCTINPQLLKYILRNTEYATSSDENRDASLMHVALEISDTDVCACGASFEMISSIQMPKTDAISGCGNFYLMNIAIKDFLTLLDDVNQVDIFSDDKLLIIRQSNFVYYFRMFSINFPDWKTKINIEHKYDLKVKKEELINVLRQMRVISPACRFSIDKDQLSLISLHGDDLSTAVGLGEECLECVSSGCGVFLIVIELLTEALSKVVGEDVVIYFSDNPNTPIKVVVDENTQVLIGTLKE